MTIDDALARIRRIKRAIPQIVAESLNDTAADVVKAIKADWPVDKSQSRSGIVSRDLWTFDPAKSGIGRVRVRIRNDAPYLAFVHDGLAFRLVPTKMREAEQAFRSLVAARLSEA